MTSVNGFNPAVASLPVNSKPVAFGHAQASAGTDTVQFSGKRKKNPLLYLIGVGLTVISVLTAGLIDANYRAGNSQQAPNPPAEVETQPGNQ